jgi:hypothetical protein
VIHPDVDRPVLSEDPVEGEIVTPMVAAISTSCVPGARRGARWPPSRL